MTLHAVFAVQMLQNDLIVFLIQMTTNSPFVLKG